tara:strand:- start:7946 stop:8422 length:477 start_codon:yes stop_codon:yes gene_type:complete
MKNGASKYGYTEWFSAQEMHMHSKEWFSKLSFVKDNLQFLNHMIQFFTNKPLTNRELERIKDFKNTLTESHRRLTSLYKQVQKHMNQLEIIIDDVSQFDMEQAYRETHRELFLQVNNYLLDYKTVKDSGFLKLSSILKKEKSKMELVKPTNKGPLPRI